jgi:tetratricopeptide (TPR) repeat protein
MDGMNGEQCLQEAYEAIYRGDFESAESWFLQAIEREPNNASYYYKASITCSRNGKLSSAMAFAGKALELEPWRPAYAFHYQTLQARCRIAEAEKMLSQSPPGAEEAVLKLREAASLDPLSAEARLYLGIAYRLLPDLQRAAASLKEALQLDPQLEEARRQLHELRTERRRTQFKRTR